MFFCEKCRYLFNVTKDVKSKQIGGKINKALTNIFQKISGTEALTNDDLADVAGRHILEDDRYEAMSKKDQRKIVSLVKAVDKNFFVADGGADTKGRLGTNEAYFICKYCKNYKPIEPGTLIYSKVYNATTIGETADYTYAIYDQTLVRTRNYICKNTKCKSHTDDQVKEAVLTKNAMDQVVYVCTACTTSWVP